MYHTQPVIKVMARSLQWALQTITQASNQIQVATFKELLPSLLAS